MSFLGRAAISRLRSSVHAAIWITAFSSEVSLRSACVDGVLELVPPEISGCAVENSGCPSPYVTVAAQP